MVTNATPEMLPKMNQLWTKYFGDSLEYSSFFFKSHLKGETVFHNQYVYIEDEQVVSMLTVLEGEIDWDTKKNTFWYIYAVVTDEAYRNRGYAGKVLRHVLELAKKQDIVVGLVPANESLYGYYQKFGFETYFYKKIEEFALNKNQAIECQLQTINAQEYKQLRDQAFCNDNYIVWDEHAVEYALQENEHAGGRAYAFRNTSYFILVCPVGEELIVRETNMPESMLKDVCHVLGKQFNCSKACICTTPSVEISGTVVAHGMIFNGQILRNSEQVRAYQLDENQIGYIGLALD